MTDMIVSSLKKNPKISTGAAIIMLVGLGIAAVLKTKSAANDDYGRDRKAA